MLEIGTKEPAFLLPAQKCINAQVADGPAQMLEKLL